MDNLDDYAAWVLHPPLPDTPTEPGKSYFVCGTPRSGSWLLSGLLASTGVAGQPHEWFYRETEETNARDWGVVRFADYLVCARAAGTTPNGVFGSKLMWAQVDDLIERLGQFGPAASERLLLERHFPNPCFIWIRREDTVAQAVSWAKAIQTGRWHHWDPADSSGVLLYDRTQIDALAREVTDDNASWHTWFSMNGIDPFVVSFEELVADPVLVTRQALAFVGVEGEGVTVRPETVSTADHVNAAWLTMQRNRPSSRG